MKKVVMIFVLCFVLSLYLFNFASAVYFPNMDTDDPDCTNYLRDNPALCSQRIVDNPIGPAFSININSIFFKGVSYWSNSLISPNCDRTLCDNFHEEGQAVCYCGLGHCCDVLSDKDGDGYNNFIYGGDDCDDNRVNVNPRAVEDCTNKIDDDCDGFKDCDDSDCFDNLACGDINSVTISLSFPGATNPKDGLTREQKANMVDSPFSDGNSKTISLKPISEYLSGTEECTGLGPSGGYFWDNNRGYGINSFASCYKIGDSAGSYVNGEYVTGNSWEEIVAEFNFYDGSPGARIKMAGGGWYSTPEGSSPDTAGSYFGLFGGSFSLCNENPAYDKLNNKVTFSGTTAQIKTELDGGYGYHNIGTATIDLVFNDYLDKDKNGELDYCQTVLLPEKGCAADKMAKTIGVEFMGSKYTLVRDDSNKLQKYFPYIYEDKDVSISLNYYFDYSKPGRKLRTGISVLNKKDKSFPVYINLFEGHMLEGSYEVFDGKIGADNQINSSGKEPFNFDILTPPCSGEGGQSGQLVLEGDNQEIVIPTETLSSDDYWDLFSAAKGLSEGASSASKWVYGRVDKTDGVAGECREVIYKNIGEVTSNSVKLVSSFNPRLNPSEFTIQGSSSTSDVVPELIRKPIENPTDEQVAITFDTKDACEGWVKVNSVVIEYLGKIVSLSGLIYSDIDSAINKYIAVKTPAGQSECVQVKFSTVPDSSAPTPSSVSCRVALKNTFISDVPDITVNPEIEVPDITVLPEISPLDIMIKPVEVPTTCEGFEVGYQPVLSSEERAEQIKNEKAVGLDIINRFEASLADKTFRNNLRLEAAKQLEKVAAITYNTKEDCEKTKIYVNWYPGLNGFDQGASIGLKSFIDSYIKKLNYGGGTADMRDKLPAEEYYSSLTDKDIDVSFGWSSGALQRTGRARGDYNAVFSLKLTYSKRPDIKKLGLFLYDPTDWDPKISGSFDSIPIGKFPAGIVLISNPNNHWKKSGDPRLIEIDLQNEYDINIPGTFWLLFLPVFTPHFGVSNKLTKEVFAIYIDGLVNGQTKEQIENSIRSFLDVNRGYRGGELKSATHLALADDTYLDGEKQYAIAELKTSLGQDFNEKVSSDNLDIKSQLALVGDQVEYLNFVDKAVNGEEFTEPRDFDNDGVPTSQDETPFGEISGAIV